MVQLTLTVRYGDTMIDELRALAIFAKVIEAGSFRAAANALNLSPSVVSHHVAQLEERLGIALIYRSTRQLSLTNEGEKLFISAKEMLSAAEKGLNRISYYSAEPTGKLTLALPAMFTKSRLLYDIAEFAKAHPKVMISILFSDMQHNLIREGIDMAIRIGDLKNSTLKSKRLFTMKRKIVVAPGLIDHRRTPKKPQDLLQWDWIGFSVRPNAKKLINQKGEIYSIDFEPRIIVDNMDAVCQLAIAGLGIVTPPAFLIEEYIHQGLLFEPLPDWQAEALPVYAVWPPHASKESITFRLITFLETKKPSYF